LIKKIDWKRGVYKVVVIVFMKTSTSNTISSARVTIERRGDLSPEQFRKEYEAKNRPVILIGQMDQWPALKKWTPQFFKDQYGARTIPFSRGEQKERNMGEFIDLVLASSRAQPAPYWTNNPIVALFPELLADISPFLPHAQPNWAARRFLHPGMQATLHRGAQIELYIGGAGGAFPVLHWDGVSTHAFLLQIYGRKQYWAWGPDQTPFMYPRADVPNLSPIGDVENPDLEKYPLFAQARGLQFHLDPGEVLFIPSRWWHTAKMEEASITISTNTLNASNWQNFQEDMLRTSGNLAAPLKRASCGLLG
jgi:Cupin-like domain